MNERRKLIVFTLSILILTFCFSYLGFVRPEQSFKEQEHIVQKSDIKIAAINEDLGTDYNGDSLQMGAILLKSFAESSQYDVEIVSRAIGEKGIKNGSYQLLVVIPSNFSKEVLALESVSPKQAVFQYQVRADKQALLKQAQQAVSDLKNSFNKDIIYIYFTSIVGNLQNAQAMMAGVVDEQNNSLLAYQKGLISPLNDYSVQFVDISNDTDSILKNYDRFDESMKKTDDALKAIMDTDKDYEPEIANIERLQDLWQTGMKKREDSIKDFDSDISQMSVSSPLEYLSKVQENKLMQMINNPSWKNLSDDTETVKSKLATLAENITSKNEEIKRYLDDGYKNKIQTAVAESLAERNNSINGTLAFWVKGLHDDMKSTIVSETNSMNIYSVSEIESFPITNRDKKILRNVNNFLHFHLGVEPNVSTPSEAHGLDGIKTYIKSKEISSEIFFDNIEGEIDKVVLSLPQEYYFTEVNGIYYANKPNMVILPSINFSAFSTPSDATVAVATPSDALGNARFKYKMRENIDKTQVSIFDNSLVSVEADTRETYMTITSDTINELERNIEQTNRGIEAFEQIKENQEQGTEDISEYQNLNIRKVTATVDTNNRIIERKYTYTLSSVLGLDYTELETDIVDNALINLKKYYHLIGQIKSLYGIDLNTTLINSEEDIKPSEDSLYNKLNSGNFTEILISIISNTLVEDVKNILTVPVTWNNEVNSFQKEINTFEKQLNDFNSIVDETNDEVLKIIDDTKKINRMLLDKPEWVDKKEIDNTELVTTTMNINSDLLTLMNASNDLARDTESHQMTSESIREQFKDLNETLQNLETEGTDLTTQVEELEKVLTDEYSSNKDFLASFVNVMSNTKQGNKRNQEVYEYLSNPIVSENADTTLFTNKNSNPVKDIRSGFLTVIINYLLSFVIAYSMQNLDIESLRTKRIIARIHISNVKLPLSILCLTGTLLGAVVGCIVGIKLNIGILETVVYAAFSVAISLAFVMTNNILLKKLKMYGVLLSHMILLLYVITFMQFFEITYSSFIQFLSYLTPLYYAEEVVSKWINLHSIDFTSIFVMSCVMVIAVAANVVEYKKIIE